MFKQVESLKELDLARTLHEIIFNEKEFIIEEMNPASIQFLFYNEYPIGLIEFTPFNPMVFTTVNNDFKFSKLPEIMNNKEKVWEMDKLGLLPEYWKKGYMKEIIECIVQHAIQYQVSYYVALLDYKLFRLTQIMYRKYGFNKAGEPFIAIGEKSEVVPVVVDVRTGLRNYLKENKHAVKN